MSVTDQEGRIKSIKLTTCGICGETLHTSFTDRHAQSTCNTCGATYILWGKRDESEYPFLDFKEGFKTVFKEYWDETGERCRLGAWMGMPRSVYEEQKKLTAWLETHHPEWLSEEEA